MSSCDVCINVTSECGDYVEEDMPEYDGSDLLDFMQPVVEFTLDTTSDLSDVDNNTNPTTTTTTTTTQLENASRPKHSQKRRLSTRNLKIKRADCRNLQLTVTAAGAAAEAVSENKKTCRTKSKVVFPPVEENLSVIEESGAETKRSARTLWKFGAKKVHLLFDEWRDRNWDNIPVEHARRYRYNYFKHSWSIDTVQVKMESDSFGHGAMRECFRIKKLSNFVRDDWRKPSTNFVAKRYLEEVDRKVYEDDVILQSVAKVWGEMYNLVSSVKKKVDICQMCLLEFNDRPTSPLYHLESFIPGEYIKYNSNSGFVEQDEKYCRNTPQAFSHFTFEYSGHALIVVDIQGVGDLYTDPQIHTNDGTGFGDGNLGTRGMALFFHSHRCNVICQALGLAPFNLSDNELRESHKVVGGNHNTQQEEDTGSPQPISLVASHTVAKSAFHNLSRCFSSQPSRMYSLSECSDDGQKSDTALSHSPTSPPAAHIGHLLSHSANSVSVLQSAYSALLDKQTITTSDSDTAMSTPMSATPVVPSTVSWAEENGGGARPRGRMRNESSCSDAGHEEAKELLLRQACAVRRSSCVAADLNLDMGGFSILAKIHHDLAQLHESGRFLENREVDEVDWTSIYYHEDQASDLGLMEALVNMGRYHLNLPNEIFPLDKSFGVDPDPLKGFHYLTEAANLGHFASILFVAESYDEGREYCDTDKLSQKWIHAVQWYERLLDHMLSHDSVLNHADDKPIYQIQARLAEMLTEGGYGLDKDTTRAYELYYEAADQATAAMKGRLAAKYYEAAELIEE